LFWGLVLLFFSLANLPPAPIGGWLSWDKLQHAVAYGILTFLGGRSLVLFGWGLRRGWFFSVGIACLFGGILEILQMWLTRYRTAEWGDFLADGLGAGIVCAAALLLNRRFSERNPQ